jgi:hypothetical protein
LDNLRRQDLRLGKREKFRVAREVLSYMLLNGAVPSGYQLQQFSHGKVDHKVFGEHKDRVLPAVDAILRALQQ